MIGIPLLLLAVQDEPVKVKEPDFERLQAKFERCAQAQRDLDAGAYDRALVTARELLQDSSVAAYSDRRVQVVRMDRMTRAWTVPLGEPREFYPKQIAARALLELAKSESNPSKKLALLEDARTLIQGSQVESSRRFEAAIASQIDLTRRAMESPREEPHVPILREVQRLREAKDFKGALAHIEKNRTALGDTYAGLKTDIETAQHREIAALASSAREILEKLHPDEKLDNLSKALKTCVPDPDKFTAVGPDLEWVRLLATTFDRYRTFEYIENAPVAQILKDLEGLLSSAMAREDIAQSRAAIRLRGHAVASAVKRRSEQARKEPLSSLEKHMKEAAALVAPLGAELEQVSRLTRETAEPGKKTFLSKVSDEMRAQFEVVDRLAKSMPSSEPALDAIRRQLEGGDPAIYGPEGGTGYRGAIASVRSLVEGEEFSRWHPEVQAVGRSLLATLLALEGFRQGRTAEEIKADCRPFVGADYRQVVTLSSKVKRLLEGLRQGS